MAPVDPHGTELDVDFFVLDKLFSESSRVLRQKNRRRRRKEGGNEASRSRSRSPLHGVLGRSRPGIKEAVLKLGGFSGSVDKIEKTVVATGVPRDADEKTLFMHFAKCGSIADVKVVRNRQDMPTGTVIVEFEEEEAIDRACALAPPLNEIMGTVVHVKRADAQLPSKTTPAAPKKIMTRSQFTQQLLSGYQTGALGVLSAPPLRKLHIKNLRSVVTEDDMRGIFKPFGEFDGFSMGEEQCWITFKTASDAHDAMSSMQGFSLVGQELQIAMQGVEGSSAVPPPAPEKMQLEKDTDFGGQGGMQGMDPSQVRIEMMQKLMGAHQQRGVPTVAGVTTSSGVSAPAPPPPLAAMPPRAQPGGPTSRTLLLQNMFDPSNVNLTKKPRFYEDIREDTHDECARFGKVLHVTVDPRGSAGMIYVLYESPVNRSAAERGLNGRWFEGKKIMAEAIDDSIWQALAAQAAPAAAAVPAKA